MESDGVLAHLHERGGPCAFDPVGDALGMLESYDVEREHSGAVRRRGSHEIGCG